MQTKRTRKGYRFITRRKGSPATVQVRIDSDIAVEIGNRAESEGRLVRVVATEAMRRGLDMTRTDSSAPVAPPLGVEGLGGGNAEGNGGVK